MPGTSVEERPFMAANQLLRIEASFSSMEPTAPTARGSIARRHFRECPTTSKPCVTLAFIHVHC